MCRRSSTAVQNFMSIINMERRYHSRVCSKELHNETCCARRDRKITMTPAKGSSFNTSFAKAARLSPPRRKSTGLAATMILAPAGKLIMPGCSGVALLLNFGPEC